MFRLSAAWLSSSNSRILSSTVHSSALYVCMQEDWRNDADERCSVGTQGLSTKSMN